MKRITVILAVVTLLTAACGDSDGFGGGDGDVAACTSFDGQPVKVVADWFNAGNPCGVDTGLSDLETTYMGIGSQKCGDGSFLYWNDSGWGATGGTWTVSDVGLPPDDLMSTCRGY